MERSEDLIARIHLASYDENLPLSAEKQKNLTHNTWTIHQMKRD